MLESLVGEAYYLHLPFFLFLFIYFWRRLFPYLVNYTYLRDAIYCSIEVSMF